MRSWRLVTALCLCACAFGQEPLPVIHGSWTATVGPARVLRGRWAGQAFADRPNSAQGSWTLLSDAGRTILEGTWAAQKTPRGWQGSWTARTMEGRGLSGTWRANIVDWHGKSFQDMLERTVLEEISGEWRSGRYAGNWWLKGSQPLAH